MAMGKPMLASVRGEAASILHRSKAAVIVEPEDSQAIAEAILRLLQNKEQLQEMGKEGRKFVLDHYSRRALAQKYLHVIQEAIAEYKPSP